MKTTSQYIHGIILIMISGLLLELIFIGHYENFWQNLPLTLLFVSFISILFLKKIKWIYVLNSIFLAVIIVGFLGVFLHLKNNYEFEMELNARLSSWQLFTRSLTGALPVLAPGSLVPLGLLGLLLVKIK